MRITLTPGAKTFLILCRLFLNSWKSIFVLSHNLAKKKERKISYGSKKNKIKHERQRKRWRKEDLEI